MESEMSLLMANQTLVRESLIGLNRIKSHTIAAFLQAASGKFIYDPFIGTGSMAYVRTYFPQSLSNGRTLTGA